VEDQKKQAEINRKKTEAQWYRELKEDPNFGGEKFLHNVKRAERVVQDYMPNLKNKLTESKVMLPPYVMKDLFLLAKQLYSSGEHVEGDPTKASDDKDKEKEVDPLAFYNS
jgi:hypothetical protein